MTSFRRLEAGQPVCLVEQKPEGAPREAPANDMITFRCANEICPNYFPLKVRRNLLRILCCYIFSCWIGKHKREDNLMSPWWLWNKDQHLGEAETDPEAQERFSERQDWVWKLWGGGGQGHSQGHPGRVGQDSGQALQGDWAAPGEHQHHMIHLKNSHFTCRRCIWSASSARWLTVRGSLLRETSWATSRTRRSQTCTPRMRRQMGWQLKRSISNLHHNRKLNVNKEFYS